MSSTKDLLHNEQYEEEQDSSVSSPASILSSPETPTNKPDSSTNIIPKLESRNQQLSLSASPSNSGEDPQVYSGSLQNDTKSGANVFTTQPNAQHQMQSPMLLPPYMPELKGPQTAPEGSLSLSNYVKLMTIQQQGGSSGGASRYQMPQGPFHPAPAGIFPDSQTGSDLATVVTPTTLPPQYQDMNYRTQCILQAQQLGSLTAGFQHPLAKASQVPAPGVKTQDDKHAMMAYQQDIARMHGTSTGPFRNSGQIRRRTTKRPHGQLGSMEQEDEGVEPGLERGSMFPSEGDGSRDDRQPLTSDIGERLPHQLKWRAHMVETWHGMCDAALIDLPNLGFHVETDKGFNFSIIDDSFVCQKKNHFQVTVTVFYHGVPKFVKMKNGSIQPIEKFTLNLHGIRFEQISSQIQLEQSRSDRSKTKYTPDIIEIPDNPEKPLKRTICRLHYSETTQNNMRKRGKPNPDQKYFSLVVALHAETPEGSLPIVAHVSERIIVRASNPGNFDNDSDYLWYRSSNPEFIFHHGRVGINTDKPDEALTVNGNIQVTGQVLQISDSRVKRNIQPVESRPHLDNISRLQLYYYQLNTDHSPTPAEEGEVGRVQVGLLAQEVREVLPEAVMETNAEACLDNGGCVKNLLMVDKDQVLMETIGAVQELKTLTGELGTQVSAIQRTKAPHSSCKQCNQHLTRTQSQLSLTNILLLLLFTLLTLSLLF